MKSPKGAWRGVSHPLVPRLLLTTLVAVGLITMGCSAKESASKGPKEDRGAESANQEGGKEGAEAPSSQARPGETPEPREAEREEPRKTLTAATVERLEAAEVRKLVQAKKALLVIAYDSEAKFAKLALQGAISRAAFRKLLPKTPKNKKLIFYCA